MHTRLQVFSKLFPLHPLDIQIKYVPLHLDMNAENIINYHLYIDECEESTDSIRSESTSS